MVYISATLLVHPCTEY